MKKIIIVLCIITIFSINSIGQSISLDQLINLRTYSLSKFEDYLTIRNWYFKSSSEEDDNSMGVATFDFGRSRYESEKASLFIKYIYSKKYDIKRVSYQLHTPVEYNKLISRSRALGYKLSENNILENSIEKVYKKNNVVIIFSSFSETQDYNLQTYYNVKIYELIDYTSTK